MPEVWIRASPRLSDSPLSMHRKRQNCICTATSGNSCFSHPSSLLSSVRVTRCSAYALGNVSGVYTALLGAWSVQKCCRIKGKSGVRSALQNVLDLFGRRSGARNPISPTAPNTAKYVPMLPKIAPVQPTILILFAAQSSALSESFTK